MDNSPNLVSAPPKLAPPPIIAAAPPKKTKKRGKLAFVIIAGFIVALVVMAIVIKGKTPPISVQTEKVARRSITEIVVATGKIQPVTEVVISPEVAGEIVALPVKEGEHVKKGDLLVQIKPDNYQATRNSSEASYKSAIANKNLAQAQLDKAEAEYKRNLELFSNKLVSDSVFLDVKTTYEVGKLQLETAAHQEDQAKFGLDNANSDLQKTTIISPIDGTVVQLKSQLGERVLGTSFNMGTEIMTVADLNEMEARVDIGEMDVVLMQPGQNTRLEVDAFKDRKFNGTVTEVANSAKGFGGSAASALGASSSSGGGGDATKFEVHIRIKEKELFRPGMSVTAEIDTRSRTNVLAVPIASVTARLPKGGKGNVTGTNAPSTNSLATANSTTETNAMKGDKKSKEAPKQVDVVFVVDGDHVKMAPVKIGISDDNYWEVTDGLQEGQDVVSGGYHAISHDLEDGKKILKSKSFDAGEKRNVTREITAVTVTRYQSMSLIRLHKISRRYQMGAETVHALREVSLDIQRGEYVAIMGPSGSGKSTLMNLIGCLDSPTDGQYELNGIQVSEMDDNRLAEVRNKEIGFVFQTFNLLPRSDALRNVELPLIYSGMPSEERRRVALEALGSVDLVIVFIIGRTNFLAGRGNA